LEAPIAYHPPLLCVRVWYVRVWCESLVWDHFSK